MPVNARVTVTYHVGSYETVYPELRTASGDVVDTERECWFPTWRTDICRLVPVADLAPSTTYQLYHLVDGAENLRSRFTTGGQQDTLAPEFDGALAVEDRYYPEEQSGSCGSYSEVAFDLTWSPATDDHESTWIRYDIFNRGDLLVPGVARNHITGSFLCSGRPDFWPYTDFEGYYGPYSVIALDVAGNASGPSREVVPRTCDEAAAGEGCGCRASRRPSATLLILLLLVALRRTARR